MKDQRKYMAMKSDKKPTGRKNHKVGCFSGFIRSFCFGTIDRNGHAGKKLQQTVGLKQKKKHEEPGHSSPFTIKEIKRRIKNIKSKVKINPSSVTVDSLLGKIPCGSPKDIEQKEKATITGQISLKLATLLQGKEEEPNIDNSRESVQEDEGRKQLADMLHMEDRVPLKSLGRLLSFPGFCSRSPIFSSRLSVVINDSSKGKDEWMDFSKHGLGCDSIKRCNEEETQNISDYLKSKAPETAANKQEKVSIPLSIVNHVSDDDDSTSRERWLMHVRSVFELGSDLGYNELENQLLDPSVFDELQNKYRQHIDSNILSDYINEATVDICRKILRPTTPSISLLVKPNVSLAQTKETFMHELCKGLERFIHMDFQHTLYHITRIDLEHEASRNVRLDTEEVANEIADEILECVIEETALGLGNSIRTL